MRIVDIKEMPGYNPNVPNGSDSVSRGMVRLDMVENQWGGVNKIICMIHGAMNAVSQDCRIWRCLMCNEGAYVVVHKPIENGTMCTCGFNPDDGVSKTWELQDSVTSHIKRAEEYEARGKNSETV